jgi:hypothetical protein
MAMVAMNMVSAGEVLGVSFYLRGCLQGIACVLWKKTPVFGSQGSKLGHLMVPLWWIWFTSHFCIYFCVLMILFFFPGAPLEVLLAIINPFQLRAHA